MAESLSQTKGRKRRSMEEPESFSHDSSSLLSEDLLRCSICLDVFTDPVSTPCGHNFCKSCLTQCWDKSQHCHCPLCKQKLTKRPELQINTTLREIADHFKKKSGSDKPEVLCDSCRGKKLKALKSCLDCGLSFCKIHLEPHYRALKLNKHKLINPVENLEDCICQNLTKTLKVKETVFTELKRIQQYAVDVTLDPDTAHPVLILSADGKQVTLGDTQQKLSDTPQRFDNCACVLGKQSFSSGRFYYEVQVRGKTVWSLGVMKENINRKEMIILAPYEGFWAVILRNKNRYAACESPSVPLTLRKKLEVVGVFVDYEEGLVSFYDVMSRSHIYSFTGQTFTEKLYPFFSPGLNEGNKNSAPLIISPVFKTE